MCCFFWCYLLSISNKLFSNIHCQSLLQLLLFEIPKGSLGLIFAVKSQIMRRQTQRCVQSSNKWTSKDSAFQLQQAFLPIKWLILQEFTVLVSFYNLWCIWGLKTQTATKVWMQKDSVEGTDKHSWALWSVSDSERETGHRERNLHWQANHEVLKPWGEFGIVFSRLLKGKMLFCKQCWSFKTGLPK